MKKQVGYARIQKILKGNGLTLYRLMIFDHREKQHRRLIDYHEGYIRKQLIVSVIQLYTFSCLQLTEKDEVIPEK